ncbi:MAG: hypothetical protein ACM31L_14470 [Actinomycetota bacterium]
MRLFRFCRRAVDSYVGLGACLALFLRLSVVAMAASVGAAALAPWSAGLAQVVDALAEAMFGVAWLRFVALGEMPAPPVHVRLGRRELTFALFWLVARSFVGFPAVMLGQALGLATGVEAGMLLPPLLVVAHALMGVFFLLPAEVALEAPGRSRWPVPDMVMQGGLAVGVGLVVAWAPAAAMVAALQSAFPAAPGPLGHAVAHLPVVVPQYLGIAAVTGYLALVWRSLLAESG